MHCYSEVPLRTAAEISEQLRKTEIASDETISHLYSDETLQQDEASYKEYVDDWNYFSTKRTKVKLTVRWNWDCNRGTVRK